MVCCCSGRRGSSVVSALFASGEGIHLDSLSGVVFWRLGQAGHQRFLFKKTAYSVVVWGAYTVQADFILFLAALEDQAG